MLLSKIKWYHTIMACTMWYHSEGTSIQAGVRTCTFLFPLIASLRLKLVVAVACCWRQCASLQILETFVFISVDACALDTDLVP